MSALMKSPSFFGMGRSYLLAIVCLHFSQVVSKSVKKFSRKVPSETFFFLLLPISLFIFLRLSFSVFEKVKLTFLRFNAMAVQSVWYH